MGFNDINLQVSGPQQPASIYKTKVLKGQVPFAVQVTEPGTKYVIKHNFVLDADVTIPANCVLEFDGGSISGAYTIIGTNSIIVAEEVCIFKNQIAIAGTWNCPTIYTTWFNDITQNNRLKQLFNLSNAAFQNEIFIREGEYIVSALTERDCILVLNSNTVLHLDGIIRLTPNNLEKFNIIYAIDSENITIEGSGSVYGDAKHHDYSSGTQHEWGINILIQDSSNVRISGISVYDAIGDGIDVGGHDIIVENFYAENCCRQGTGNYSKIFYNVIWRNFTIKDCIGHVYNPYDYGFGLSLEIDHTDGYINNINIENGIFINCHQPIVANNHNVNTIDFRNIKISNIKILDCIDENSRTPFILKGIVNAEINNIYIKNCIYNIQFEINTSKNIKIDGIIIEHSNEGQNEIDLSLWSNDNVVINNYSLISTSNSKIISAFGNGRYTINNAKIKTNNIYYILGSSSLDKKLYCLTYNNCNIDCTNFNVDRSVNTYFKNCQIQIQDRSVIGVNSDLHFIDSILSCTIGETLSLSMVWYISASKVYLESCKIETLTDREDAITNGIFHGDGSSDQNAELDLINCTLNFQGLNINNRFIVYHVYKTLCNFDNVYPKSGTIRPDFNTLFGRNGYLLNGFSFFDTTINKLIYSIAGSSGWASWKEEDMANAGVKRSGTTTERPVGTAIYVDFQYFDTTLNKPIYAKTISGSTVTWVDATGATV